MLAVLEEQVEIAAIALEVIGAEHRPEGLLHLADTRADANLCAGSAS